MSLLINDMKIIKTIRTHSESINSLLICKNGNLISASLGRIIFYSKKNLEVILRKTEFKHFYISHINELHKDNTFIFCHNGFIIFETSEDNKTYKVLYSFYERFLFHKSIEFDYKCEINSNIKYNIIISSIYGIHIFENKKINDENNEGWSLIKKINVNEIVYNIFKLDNNTFISTSNTTLAGGNNCLRFWSFNEFINTKTINNLTCSSGTSSISKYNERILLVSLEKIIYFSNKYKDISKNLNNINGIAVIDLKYLEIIQYIEMPNKIRSLLLTKNNNILAGSIFNVIQFKFNNGNFEEIGEKEIFNYINNVIVEIEGNCFIIGSINKLIFVLK